MDNIEIVEEVENVFILKGLPKKILYLKDLDSKIRDWRIDILKDKKIYRKYLPAINLDTFREVYDLSKRDGDLFLYFSEIKNDTEYIFNKYNEIKRIIKWD